MPGTVFWASRRVARRVRSRPAWVAGLAIAVLLPAVPASLTAAESGGTVVGSVVLAAAARRGEKPVRNQGFVRRVPNALKPPRALDPTPHLVIVLDGATPPEEDRQPPSQPVRYTIIGESFEVPLLPVVVGSVVEIRNAGRGAPRLYSPGKPDLVPTDPIGPRGERKTRKIEPAFVPFDLR